MIRKNKLEELYSYIEELKTIQKTSVKNMDKGFLSIEKVDCLLNNGQTIRREQIMKNGHVGSAVLILPITKENNTVLIVQPRVFNDNTIGVEFPAGYIDVNEKPSLAALRELKEETGYIPTSLIEVASYYQDQGCSGAYNHSFIAFGCERISKQNLDKDEYIRYFECTYEEAIELLDMGYINDAGSMLLLEKSKVYMKGVKKI